MIEDRKVAVATHNITAWYLKAKLKPDAPQTSLVADYDDDGEAHAGGRLLHLVTMAAVEGVAVMVRHFFSLFFINYVPFRRSHDGTVASN